MNSFRFLTYTLVACASFCTAEAQQYNLVPNPNFEQYSICPDALAQIAKATGWQMWQGSPDFFHACDESQTVSTPFSTYNGFQHTFNGLGYGGLIGIAYNNIGEVMGIELSEPLQIGQMYYIEFQWSRAFGGIAHSWCDCANSHLGAVLTTQGYVSNTNPYIHNSFAHIYDDQLLVDTTSWQSISGWITADQAYTHIGIGTFFNLNEIEVAYFNGSPQEIFLKTYYYIDGVCVATDPAYCDVVLNAGNLINNDYDVQVYPNPANALTFIEAAGEFSYHLIEITGRTVLTGKGTNKATLRLENVPQGAYLLKIETNSGVLTKKLIKNP